MSLFDSVIENTESDKPPFRQAPEGHYLVTVRQARKVKANSGTEGIELQFTMQENLDDADMEGVDLARCRLRNTIWVSEKSIDIVRRTLSRIAPETVGQTFTDALDILPGAEAVVNVTHLTEDRNGKVLDIPYLEVKGYYSKDWFFNNRMKAA
jgi:hypothetical protein